MVLSLREARLVRQRIGVLLKLRTELMEDSNPDAIHDLRVASRRMREALDYLQTIPPKWKTRLMTVSKQITKKLGGIRECEVNLGLLYEFRNAQMIDPLAAELLIHDQKRQLDKRRLKALKHVSRTKFAHYEKFLQNVKGSRTASSSPSTMMDLRMHEFFSFGWSTALDDEHLHDLRIRSKKLRYATEIYEKISGQRQGRLLSRIRKLQELLGQIHDLFVLAELVRETREQWEDPDVKLASAALKQAHEFLVSKKISLYPRVYPLYTKIIGSVTLFPRFEFQTSPAVVN